MNRVQSQNDSLWADFTAPKDEYRSIPKWIWNTPLQTMTADEMERQLRGFRDRDGYGGVMIVLWGHKGYLSEEFYQKYGQALDIAEKLGIRIILWDENGFPTGFAGGVFETLYPENTAKRLDMTEIEITGPKEIAQAIPGDGILMGAVSMNPDTGERIDITSYVKDGILKYSLPDGHWKLLFFHCVKAEPFGLFGGQYRFIDYLDEDAVKKFVGLTHQGYYDRFARHFGTTIQFAFYDEPSFWRLKGRIWTEKFNLKFEQEHGYNPVLLYPALWFDIGSETAFARTALLSFRANLYATAFVKTLADWCEAHHIRLTGHMDQEEIANPTPLTGDLMKVFEHQHIPGVDEIMAYGRGSKAYKIVSSAAFNYDKPLVMCETCGAMGEGMPVDVLYKEAMDQYAKGINFTVPHGTWYDNQNNVIFPPELSFRSKKFGSELPVYNRYIARVIAMLQGGRHVADIAVLYPIASLQAANRFGEGDAYHGGTIAEEANYMELGELLSLRLRRDFTYLHPEVLDGKCRIDGSELVLENPVNREQYKVIILPGEKVIHYSNLQKIVRFYENGGIVIGVGKLPEQSAESGHDEDVKALVEKLFGTDTGADRVHTNSANGRAYYIQNLGERALETALDEAVPVPDIALGDVETVGGNLTYIHKIKESRNFYFIANSSDLPSRLAIRLRGAFELELWDPHSGERREMNEQHTVENNTPVTLFDLEMPSVHSVFITVLS